MASIEILSCAALIERLKKVQAEMPSTAERMNNRAARLKLRVREIGGFVGRHQPKSIYHELAGRKPITPDLQRKLSCFFHMWDRGVLVKEIIDGKAVIVYRDPQRAQPPAQEPLQKSKTMRIEITNDGVKLRL